MITLRVVGSCENNYNTKEMAFLAMLLVHPDILCQL